MQRDIMISGLGWIASGIVCFAVWCVKYGLTPASSEPGLIYIGFFLLAVGAALLAFNKKIGRIIDLRSHARVSRSRTS